MPSPWRESWKTSWTRPQTAPSSSPLGPLSSRSRCPRRRSKFSLTPSRTLAWRWWWPHDLKWYARCQVYNSKSGCMEVEFRDARLTWQYLAQVFWNVFWILLWKFTSMVDFWFALLPPPALGFLSKTSLGILTWRWSFSILSFRAHYWYWTWYWQLWVWLQRKK